MAPFPFPLRYHGAGAGHRLVKGRHMGGIGSGRKPRVRATATPETAAEGLAIEPIAGWIDDEEEVEEAIAKLRAEIGDDDDIRVQIKRTSGSGAAEWVDSMPLQQIVSMEISLEEYLRGRWGPGRYLIRARRPDGTWAINKTTRIAAPPLDRLPPAAAPATVPPEMLAAIQSLQQQVQALTNSRQVDPTAQMRQTLELLALMKTTFAPAGPPAAPPKSTAEMMQEMAAFMAGAQQLAGMVDKTPEPDDPMVGIAGKVVDLVIAAQSQQVPAMAPAAAVLPALRVPATLAAVPPAEPAPEGGDVAGNQLPPEVVQAMRALNAAAPLGEFVVNHAADSVWENSNPELIAMLQGDLWWSTLQRLGANTAYADWFQAVRDRVLAIEAEENGQGPTERSTGQGNAAAKAA
jgi:hypothetical protein